MKGDDHLCVFELQLWGIVYTVITEWQTLVIFQWKRMHVPWKLPGVVTFFVPTDATFRYEICEFIQGHLDRMARDSSEDYPGLMIQILTFKGVHPELPAGTSDAMLRTMIKDFLKDMGTPTRRLRIKEQARIKIKDDPKFLEKILDSMLPSKLEKLL